MAANESQPLYCGSGVDAIHTSYKNWHGYVSMVVCILGTIANTLNIIVLSRREMRSPTNAILTGLAVADLAVMIEYMPYTVHDFILSESLPPEQRLSYAWVCFVKFHSIFTQVLHTISIWLTVTLAVWRYIAVGYPQKNRIWCGMRTTIITILTAYIVCILIVTPSLYVISTVAEFRNILDEHGRTVNMVPLSQYIIDYNNEMKGHTRLHGQHGHAQGQGQGQQQSEYLLQTNGDVAGGELMMNASSTAASSSWNTSYLATLHASANAWDNGLLGIQNNKYNNNIVNEFVNAGYTTNTPDFNTAFIGFVDNASNASTSTISSVDIARNTTTTPMLTTTATVNRNVTVYRLYYSDLALRNQSLQNATFLIYSVLIKLIPCVALTILSVRLIAALLEAKRRRNVLTSNAANGMKVMVNGKAVERPRKNSKLLEKEKQTDRTTRMLLAVLLLFLITEFPQGIMGLLNTVLGDAFYMQCYLKFSDLMDILALINSSINFILYCSMSRQFRSTFSLLFRPKFLDKWLPVAQEDEAIGGNGVNGRLRTEMGSKSGIGEQQFLTTQVTNV